MLFGMPFEVETSETCSRRSTSDTAVQSPDGHRFYDWYSAARIHEIHTTDGQHLFQRRHTYQRTANKILRTLADITDLKIIFEMDVCLTNKEKNSTYVCCMYCKRCCLDLFYVCIEALITHWTVFSIWINLKIVQECTVCKKLDTFHP